MLLLGGKTADAAAPAHSSSASWDNPLTPTHLQPPLCNTQLRCRARDAAPHCGRCTAPRRSRLRRSSCHAQHSATGAAAAAGSSTAVPPAAAAVSQAGSTKAFDVVHLGNLCLDIIVPVDELPPDDTGVCGNSNTRLCRSSIGLACCYSGVDVPGAVVNGWIAKLFVAPAQPSGRRCWRS